MSIPRPYTQEPAEDGFLRTFSKETDPMDLVWHRDNADRTFTVLEGEGWMFQRDNESPVKMEKGKSYSVDKMVYHRAIKGDTDLKIKVREY